MNANIFPIQSWWIRRRLQYNKALVFTGLMGFGIQAAQQCFKFGDKPIIDGLVPEMRISATCFIAFLILANIAFTIGSVINLLAGDKKGLLFREQLFTAGYWFAIVVLILMIIAFIYLI
jgi:hypothetical protein